VKLLLIWLRFDGKGRSLSFKYESGMKNTGTGSVRPGRFNAKGWLGLGVGKSAAQVG
jgi:hypothetical protein